MKPIQKYLIKAILLAGAFFILSPYAFLAEAIVHAQTDVAYADNLSGQLTPEELVDLVRPAVVRIVTHITGQVVVPNMDIDLNSFTISILPDHRSVTLPVDTSITGSGFIINPDGYVLTNSHVISQFEVKDQFYQEIISTLIANKMRSLSAADQQQVRDNLSKKFGDINGSLSADMKSLLIKQIFVPLQNAVKFSTTSTITVINPSTKGSTLAETLKDGFSASIVSVNENYAVDQRDIGIIKIAEQDLPNVQLGSAAALTTGEKIYVFGFPSSAEFNKQDLLEPSFTQGVISAIKKSDSREFSIFQTDAKVSHGSSGGPLLSANGTVQGIITFESAAAATTGSNSGDNFAFAIPIELAKNVLDAKGITNTAGVYQQGFIQGILLEHANNCQQALVQLDAAKHVNGSFSVLDRIGKYEDICKKIIQNGQSVDSAWGAFKQKLRHIDALTWIFLICAAVAIALIIGVIIFLDKRMRREELEIQDLEAGRGEHLLNSKMTRNAVNHPPHVSIDPALWQYVRDCRASGISDGVIKTELLKAGWDPLHIEMAMGKM